MIIYSHTRISDLISKSENETIVDKTTMVEEETTTKETKKKKSTIEELIED